MMDFCARTDLAEESRDLWRRNAGQTAALPGVMAKKELRAGLESDRIEILSAEGERALGKPRGRYLTLRLDVLERREQDAFERSCAALADMLRELLELREGESVLVAGLGNEAITPDALGPLAAEHTMVTRHLKERLPEDFAAFRSVSVFRSGVLGTTGLESSALVGAVSTLSKPSRIVAIDALCAADAEKLCRTVQVSDAGIVPGSGVGNARAALSRETLGVPVIAVGVPTVVDAAVFGAGERGLIVTPRDIDRQVRDAARLIGYALNLALHPGLTIGDIDMFLS